MYKNVSTEILWKINEQDLILVICRMNKYKNTE